MSSSTLRNQLLMGPGHPLFIGAVGLLLLNDHVWKARYPSPWLTGKLSDVAWLIVAPVLLATVLAAARVPSRWARALAITLPGVAFVALQVWPPLGQAWVDLFGGAHVADLPDLLTLPALLLVPLAWRTSGHRLGRTARRAGMVVGAGALMATSYAPDFRVPCDETLDWDPQRPLVLRWSIGEVPDNPALLATGISLQNADQQTIPIEVKRTDTQTVLVCPEGGLAPNTTYTWQVGGWEDLGPHVRGVPAYGAAGTRTFTTAATSSWTDGCSAAAARDLDDCYLDSGSAP